MLGGRRRDRLPAAGQISVRHDPHEERRHAAPGQRLHAARQHEPERLSRRRCRRLRSYTDNYTDKCLIYGEKLQRIAITGRGVIDGQGAAFKGPYKVRPYMIRFIECRDVVVEGVTMKNSPMWVQHYLACDDVRISGITVASHVNAEQRRHRHRLVPQGLDHRLQHRFRRRRHRAQEYDGAALPGCGGQRLRLAKLVQCPQDGHGIERRLSEYRDDGLHHLRHASGRRGAGDRRRRHDGPHCCHGHHDDRRRRPDLPPPGEPRPALQGGHGQARHRQHDATSPSATSRRPGPTRPAARSPGCPTRGSRTSPSATSGSRSPAAARPSKPLAPSRKKPQKYPEYAMFGRLPAYGLYCRHVDGLKLTNVQLQLAGADKRHAVVLEDVTECRARRIGHRPLQRGGLTASSGGRARRSDSRLPADGRQWRCSEGAGRANRGRDPHGQ